MNEQNPAQAQNHSLSFTKLTAMIIGSTIGGGIFTTAGDMAASGAHTGSVLIGWAICGIGMFCLMMCFFGLNRVRPDLTNGIYSYAKEGFGEFVGFNSAWGYWVSALLCNVSYTTLLFGAIGHFFPIFGDGNNLLSIVCASAIIWLLNALILRGVQEAAALNVITTIAKLIPILLFVIAVIFFGAFRPAVFMEDFWGADTPGAPDISTQIKATTSATVWSFIGVEGAVVLSARAKHSADVGKASLTGFLGIFAIYVLVAILSMGVLTTEELASLKSPQMAGILQAVIGPWGAAIVNIGVILSLAGALLGCRLSVLRRAARRVPQGFRACQPKRLAVIRPLSDQRTGAAVSDRHLFQRLHLSGLLHVQHDDDHDSVLPERAVLSEGHAARRRLSPREKISCFRF